VSPKNKEKKVLTTNMNLNWRIHCPNNFRFARIYSKWGLRLWFKGDKVKWRPFF